MKIGIGPKVILAYRRLAYTAWHAFAEFVDNSTQSYEDHKDRLDPAYSAEEDVERQGLYVYISYERDPGTIVIEDNALGMDRAELEYALQIAEAPKVATGRSQYGLGLKTAACWFGDLWSVKTRKLGSKTEYTVTVDVTEVAKGAVDLPVEEKQFEDVSSHYTIVTIERLHQRFATRTLGKIKTFLPAMYRHDIEGGTLDLRWQGERLKFFPIKDFAKDPAGTDYYQPFKFELPGADEQPKVVHGWFGILGNRKRGRSNAGLVVFRRGRALRAHPDEWRPELIFGDARNDLINQRITGEIHFDDFEVSHTKDGIQWQGDEEERVEKKLKELMEDYLAVARTMRVTNQNGPTEKQVQKAVDKLSVEMASSAFDAKLSAELPLEAAFERAMLPLLSSSRSAKPRIVQQIGDASFAVYLANDASESDPYYARDVKKDVLRIVVNARHPHWTQLVGAGTVLTHLRHCAYDAVAEWKCTSLDAELLPDTIKLIKDDLLRLPSELKIVAEDGELDE